MLLLQHVLFYLHLGTISLCLVLGDAVRERKVSKNYGDDQLPCNNCEFKAHSTHESMSGHRRSMT